MRFCKLIICICSECLAPEITFLHIQFDIALAVSFSRVKERNSLIASMDMAQVGVRRTRTALVLPLLLHCQKASIPSFLLINMNLLGPSLRTHLLYLVLKYLHEKGWKESVHELERESRLYFDIKYFEEMVLAGKWDDIEYYLSGFTKVDDNMHSRKIFFDLKKQKYYEALDSNDGAKTLDILKKDLKVFSQDEQELFNELTKLLTLNNSRKNKTLKIRGDAISARKIIWEEIKKVIMENPVFKGNLVFPTIEDHRLTYLLNQSLNWMHQFCEDQDCKLLSNTTVTDSAPIQDEESTNKSMPRKLPEFFDPSECKISTLPLHPLADKIVRLSYNNAGNKILALASNGHYLVWEWPNPSSQDVFAQPQIYLPRNGLQSMRNNDLTRTTNNVYSFAISKRDEFLLSTSGGNIYIFSMSSFLTRVNMSLPTLSVATCVAYYPLDNNVIFVGMDDSNIMVFNVNAIEHRIMLEGHSKRVTSLAFSTRLNILVSAHANAQIFVWDATKWKKLRDKRMPIHVDIMAEETSGTEIQFNRDLEHFLAVRSTILAIYEAKDLLLVKQWAVPEGSPMLISQATFSCDGMSVYASFVNGSVAIFDAFRFEMLCRINSSTFLSTYRCSPSVYPLAITAHPLKNSQFAVGLSDGMVFVFEPQAGCDWCGNSCIFKM